LTVAARRLACPLALGLLPVVVMAVIVVAAALAGTLGMDFTGGVLHRSHAYEGTGGGLTRGFFLAGLILAAYIVATLRKVRGANARGPVEPALLRPLTVVR
jgi:hypothetical protein